MTIPSVNTGQGYVSVQPVYLLDKNGVPIDPTNPVVVLSGMVVADDGVALPIDSLAQTLTYSAGLVSTATVSYGGETYVQTYTATAGYITGISQWVKQ